MRIFNIYTCIYYHLICYWVQIITSQRFICHCDNIYKDKNYSVCDELHIMCLYIVKSEYQQWRMTVMFQKWGDGFLYDSVYLGVLFHDGWLCLVCNAGLCLVPDLPSPRNSEGWSQKQNVLLPHCQLVCATGVDHCLSVCIRGRLLLWHCKDVYHTLCFVIKSVFERKNMHQLSFNGICINLFRKELNYLI